MAGRQFSADGVPESLAGMSRNQLYDIMSQMKALIEQNKQQARQILIQNPLLTKALFQAQIMLGMVQPPQVIPNIQPTASQYPQQSAHPVQQSNTQAAPSLPGQFGLQDQTSASQTLNPVRKQQQNQHAVPNSSASVPPPNLQSQSLPSHSLQSVQLPKAHLNVQSTPMSLPQSSQVPNMPSLPIHSTLQLPSLQTPMPPASTQLQQPIQTSGIPHLPLQPPLPPQPRPPSMPSFPHQLHSQMGSNAGFQHSSAPQLHHSQSMFHQGTRPPTSMGALFPQRQPPLQSQPPQSMYQMGGSQLVTEFGQVGSSLQADRGSSWMHGLGENTAGTQLTGPPSILPGQMGPGNQPPRPPPLSPEMEKALLQQVMSLTPEQINLLPPDQRAQVVQLQQMLRQ